MLPIQHHKALELPRHPDRPDFSCKTSVKDFVKAFKHRIPPHQRRLLRITWTPLDHAVLDITAANDIPRLIDKYCL